MAMFVKSVEIRFGNKDSFPNIDKRMNHIEEKFSKGSINYPFKTVLKSYAEEDSEQMHIFEEWQEIIKIDYSVFLRNMTILMI